MYLVKTCPSCKTKIRFPIDKGTIRVTCSCGYSFIANPDNTDIYKNASFDLRNTKHQGNTFDSLKKTVKKIQVDQMKAAVINWTLSFKYKIQNFRLLPNAERKKIIFTLLLICASICAGIILLISAIYSGVSSEIII
ncbi:MAG: hypothetical protein JW807_01185 [Spirochaetes bacterium]|nr:hypothetical protein [Spirochaetota bacterium]